MPKRITRLSTSTPEQVHHEFQRSLFDRIFLGAFVWIIPLILASLLLSGSLPRKQVSSAEDAFVYGIKRQLYRDNHGR